jgi:hypothetical protein
VVADTEGELTGVKDFVRDGVMDRDNVCVRDVETDLVE